MNRDLTNIFIDEIYFNPAKKDYDINKTEVKHVIGTWSADLLVFIDYKPSNNNGF